MRQDSDRAEDEDDEDDDAEQRSAARLAVRVEGDRGDDRSVANAVVEHRKRVQTGPFTYVRGALRAAGERARGPVDVGPDARRLERPSAGEHPDLAGRGEPIALVQRDQYPVSNRERGDLLLRLGLRQRGRARRQPLVQQHREHGERDGERDRDSAHDREQQPRPDPEPGQLHRSE